MLKRDQYINIALQESYKSNNLKIKIGCIAVYNNVVIARGHNNNKTHPLQYDYNSLRFPFEQSQPIPTLHAEIDCLNRIKHLDIDFRKIKLFIARNDLNGNSGMCRPCKACMQAIKDLGITNIYYTTREGIAHEIISTKIKFE